MYRLTFKYIKEEHIYLSISKELISYFPARLSLQDKILVLIKTNLTFFCGNFQVMIILFCNEHLDVYETVLK